MHATNRAHNQETCDSCDVGCRGNIISNLCGYYVKAVCWGNRKFDFNVQTCNVQTLLSESYLCILITLI